jgi:hypothetical protein
MKLRNGNRFLIECKEGEEITYVLKSGTVSEVATNLDGTPDVKKKGQLKKFIVTAATSPRRLNVMYVFKASSGESYVAEVTGNDGGDTSTDDFVQPSGLAAKARRYVFTV